MIRILDIQRLRVLESPDEPRPDRTLECDLLIAAGGSALVPRETHNLLPAGKSLGTTHITNGAYRLHPIEWAVGKHPRSSRASAWIAG